MPSTTGRNTAVSVKFVFGVSAYEKAAAPSLRHLRDNARVLAPVHDTTI